VYTSEVEIVSDENSGTWRAWESSVQSLIAGIERSIFRIPSREYSEGGWGPYDDREDLEWIYVCTGGFA
jgi:hypothetical protein